MKGGQRSTAAHTFTSLLHPLATATTCSLPTPFLAPGTCSVPPPCPPAASRTAGDCHARPAGHHQARQPAAAHSGSPAVCVGGGQVLTQAVQLCTRACVCVGGGGRGGLGGGAAQVLRKSTCMHACVLARMCVRGCGGWHVKVCVGWVGGWVRAHVWVGGCAC